MVRTAVTRMPSANVRDAMPWVSCAVDKTSEVLAAIQKAVEGDADEVMKGWDTNGDLKGDPVTNDDGSVTLRS